MYTIIFLLTTVILVTNSQIEIIPIYPKLIEADVLLVEDKLQLRDEKVKIQLYYESRCPGCIDFDTNEFLQVSLRLENYIDVHTYPYGNAQYKEGRCPCSGDIKMADGHGHLNIMKITIINPNGTVEFICQHGKEECYGNMLHACAIDILANVTASIKFNACLMSDDPGSDDVAADKCGQQLGVDAASIKKCAKGQKGKDLLKYYGDESHKANYNYVPFVLINGVEWEQSDKFLESVCQEFKVQPPPCKKSY